MASNSNTLIGRILGNCTLERLIGQGGMGAVYLAQQARPSRYVAVKVLFPRGVIDNTTYNEFLTRFRREADLIARLEHINIVPIYEYGEQDGFAYLVMPNLSGGSLRNVLAQRGALPLTEVATYIDQAGAALDYAHAHGVIHRDLKPANFLLHSDGRLVLADFGIARIMQDSNSTITPTLTSTGMFLGTPEYMPPEMIRSEHIDYRADIYELGIVLFQMLTGYIPFKGDTPLAVAVKHIQEPLPALHQVNSAIPSAVDTVVQKATAKRREDRYISVAEMAYAFRVAISGEPREAQYQAERISINTLPDDVPGIDARYVSNPSFPQLTSPPRTMPQYQAPVQPVQYAANASPATAAPNWQSPKPSTPGSAAYSNSARPIAPHETGTAYPIRKNNLHPWLLFLAVSLVLALVLGGIFIGRQIVGANATNQSLGTSTNLTPQPSIPTVTVTTGTSPAIIPTSLPTPTPSPTPVVVTSQQAEALVQQYYNYINQQDYQDAYNLLGSKLQSNQTYNQFASGFSNTVHDDIAFGSITPLPDGTVQVALNLTATETTGTSTFQGYYVVGVQGDTLKLVDAQFNQVG